MKPSKLNRDVHRWGSLLVALPVAVIIVTGVSQVESPGEIGYILERLRLAIRC